MDSLIIFLAKDLFVAVALIWLVAFFIIPRNVRKQFALTFIIAAVIAVIISRIAGALYFHPRPFAAQHIVPLIPHDANDNGFPSDHALLVTTIAASIYFYHKKLAAAAFVLGLLVATGRVWAHLHSPLDILGAMAIGILAGWVGNEISKRILNREQKTKPL